MAKKRAKELISAAETRVITFNAEDLEVMNVATALRLFDVHILGWNGNRAVPRIYRERWSLPDAPTDRDDTDAIEDFVRCWSDALSPHALSDHMPEGMACRLWNTCMMGFQGGASLPADVLASIPVDGYLVPKYLHNCVDLPDQQMMENLSNASSFLDDWLNAIDGTYEFEGGATREE